MRQDSSQSKSHQNDIGEGESRENPLRAEKRAKLRRLRELGINPFPYRFDKTHSIDQLRQNYQTLQAGEVTQQLVKVAGRIVTMRSMGKASFFNILDQTGPIQIYFRNEELTPLEVQVFDAVDIGDIVGVEGFVFKTKKGELSIHTQRFTLLTKTLEPLPEKYHGLQDVELKYRYRHLDLISNWNRREVFLIRSKIIREIRNWMDSQGFLEVETPTLQPIYGGAAAHPFVTHHRALDRKLYLKISPELYLKRLIVGGFEKVYEISKNFRNEGIDRTHNPEFTMMEWYEAYTDYLDQLDRFESLICHLVQTIHGSLDIEFQGQKISFQRPWRRLRVLDGVREYVGIDPDCASLDELRQRLIEIAPEWKKPEKNLSLLTWGELVMELFEQKVEPHLIQPTFVMDHPVEISPLTKRHREDPRLVERFEPFVAGMEIGNSYSELNDPEDQRNRLKEQEAKRVIDEEAHPMDEDFLHAIDVGLPPTGGVGLGIERLVMILTNQASIRDIIFFPALRDR